ncbi:MAG: ArnT family glycosyltransferase [Streptosporangiaceae bacterium]
MTVLTRVVATPPAVRAQTSIWPGLRWLPVVVILAAQAALTIRLIPTGIASHDESGYIYAGHQLIHEFWHGGGSPYYETYFSGAPVIYPVLAAMVDHLGGLVAVRLMSTFFMLTATALSFATARRLFGYFPGIISAGLFAGLGLTQDLGAYATYDAMAIMIVAAAAYCAVRSADSSFWLLAVPAVILAANATKYATFLFDPVVIALAATQAGTWQAAAKRFFVLSLAVVSVLVFCVFLAGAAYLKGILFTTLARPAGEQSIIGATRQPVGVITAETWDWVGVILALGVVALILTVCTRQNGERTAVVTTLVVAGMLVTFEALRLHSDESMRKHDDYGAWFTCVAAGYSVAYLVQLIKARHLRHVGVVLALGGVAMSGAHYTALAASTYEAGRNSEISWPSAKLLPFFATMRPYLTHPGGRFLVGGVVEDQLPYADHITIPWYDYVNDVYFKYPIPGRGGDASGQVPGPACTSLGPRCTYLEGEQAYQAAIWAGWFAVISLVGNHGIALDTVIHQAVTHTPGYVLFTRVGGAPTWIYAPAYPGVCQSRRGCLAR